MSWTDERVATLTKMWGEGNSASQIAKELGGVTRNAVIGKVHRLGLSNRATTTKAKAAPKAVKEAPKTKAKPKEPVRVANPKSTTEIPTARDIPRKRPIITAGQP
ncbi:MAG: GcrA cell cycle regulator, partial [Rhodobacteraceae bacterium]|nr:GcrA cell cycle regulator [Paracoccaceae bacterium]